MNEELKEWLTEKEQELSTLMSPSFIDGQSYMLGKYDAFKEILEFLAEN